ncbi:MAG: hypothetical protein AUI93_04195 [Crenarchaeota archaeon 13_1_40CM_3_52_10]|nr:MAG: hypothetical protein AUI93_04195 [Crenarchaeota archaeon 13_1_40CM_3_52_10]
MPSPSSEGSVKVLIEILRLSRERNRVQITDVASSARVTDSFAKRVLTDALIENDNDWISLSPRFRISLALDIARAGRLSDSARVLTWQEFGRRGFKPRRM